MKILDLYRATAFLVVLLACSNLGATDFGVVGKTYAIYEKNFLDYVAEHIKAEAEKGKVEEANRQLVENSKKYAMRPPGIQLPRAEEYSVHDFDPTFVVNGDISDHKGVIIYKAGTRVNPFDHKNWTKMFCFLDGDDVKQVDWVLNYCGDKQTAKIILVDGPVGHLMKEYPDYRFYFDQKQKLSQKFSLQALPSVVRQSGRVIVIEEFPVE